MGKLVIDGNSVYEIDEECIQRRGEWEKQKIEDRERHNAQTSPQRPQDKDF